MSLYATILAGGGGTRFWPYSRVQSPKQFLVLQETHSLLQMTVRRIIPLIPLERIVVITAAHLQTQTQEQLPELPAANVLIEPVGRNTAAAIGLAAQHLLTQDRDATMVVLPADHAIANEQAFHTSVQQAANAAHVSHGLIALGIRPTYAATGYGYMQVGAPLPEALPSPIYQVLQFTEKPSAEVAQRFVDSGQYLWNCGIFVWEAATIWQEMTIYLPDLVQGLQAYLTASQTHTDSDHLRHLYMQLPDISIDYGVLEHSSRISALPVSFVWYDVGSWRALSDLHAPDADGNVVFGRHIGRDTQNSLIYSPTKLVTTIGVNNLIVVCADDVILICPKDRDQEVRELVHLLRQRGHTAYL